MDGEKIIALFFRCSETAIAEASRRYGRYCYSIAYRILHSHRDSEECVNDAYSSAVGFEVSDGKIYTLLE